MRQRRQNKSKLEEHWAKLLESQRSDVPANVFYDWGLPEIGFEDEEGRALHSWVVEPLGRQTCIVFYSNEPTAPGVRGVIPGRFFALVDGRPRLTLELVIEEGQLVCHRATVNRRPGEPGIGTMDLRRIQLRRVIEAVGAEAIFDTTAGPDDWVHYRGRLADAHKPQRGKRLSDEHFQQVAGVYRTALAQGRPPTAAVARAFHTSRANAGRWVMEARRRGFLGEALPRQAGERKVKARERRSDEQADAGHRRPA